MLEIVKTADGSNTVFNSEVGEHYHSRNGALQESMHVFVNSGLRFFLETSSKALVAPSKRQSPHSSPPPAGGETLTSLAVNVSEKFSPDSEKTPGYFTGIYRETADPLYYEQLKTFSRENRRNPTEAENLLWQFLRKDQTGFKIRRQHAISIFIADFVCLQKGLVIELDGHHHKLNKEGDDARTEALNYLGFTVIRFDNESVIKSPQKVFEEIKEKLNTLADRDLNPSQPSPIGRALKNGTDEAAFTRTIATSAAEVSPPAGGGDLEGAQFEKALDLLTTSAAEVSPSAGGGDLEGASVAILEVGFGTGLNFLLTADFCTQKNIHLDYTGIEAYPLRPEMISQTGYEQYVPADLWQTFNTNYQNALASPAQLNPICKLQIAGCKLQEFTSDEQYDIIYFDAFAVAFQPEMWDETAIGHTIQFLKPGGVFVTYAITGNLKRALKALGCKVEKAPGAAGKREMLRAIKL